MEWLWEQLKNYGMTIGLRLVAAILVFVIGFKIINFIVKRFRKGRAFSKMDPSAAGFIASFLSIACKAVIIVSVIAIMGVPMSSVVAVIASAGVAIGLAVQGALSNFVGGMMLLLFKPFVAGDFVEAQSVSGTVKEISVFYTVLVTPDNKVVTLPNGTLTNSVIINYSAEDTRRVDVTFRADYSCDIEKAKAVMLEVASRCPKALKKPEAVVVLTECADSAIQYTLRVWCNSDDFWDVKAFLTEGVRNSFKENGISIPYPQMDVHIKKD